MNPKSAKKDSQVGSIFLHICLISSCIKTARKMLVKSTPGANFINILREA
jgi:hypothetical protein